MPWKIQRHLATGLMCVAFTHGAIAQDNAGAQIGLTLSPGFVYDDDEGRARLGFDTAYETTTRNQRFLLGLDGAFDSGYEELDESLRSPRLRLSYGRESSATEVTAQLSFQRDTIDALVFDDNLDRDFLESGTGLRTDLNASLGLTFGRSAPFGGSVDLGYRSRGYPDADDPRLLEEETANAGLSLRFTIDPRVTARVSGRFSETDVENPGTDQRRTSVNAGLDLAVSRTLDVSLALGATKVVSTSPVDTETNEGASSSLTAVRALPDGTLSAAIASDLTAGGRLSTLRVDRAFDLPDGATLGFGAGIGQVDENDVQTLVRLSWSGETRTGGYSVRVDRTLAVNNEGDSALNSIVSLSWRQDLNRVSSFRTGLSLRDTTRLDDGADQTQANLSLGWRRDLTEDWGVRATYTHRWTQEEGADETEDYTVFLGFEREFQWRP